MKKGDEITYPIKGVVYQNLSTGILIHDENDNQIFITNDELVETETLTEKFETRALSFEELTVGMRVEDAFGEFGTILTAKSIENVVVKYPDLTTKTHSLFKTNNKHWSPLFRVEQPSEKEPLIINPNKLIEFSFSKKEIEIINRAYNESENYIEPIDLEISKELDNIFYFSLKTTNQTIKALEDFKKCGYLNEFPQIQQTLENGDFDLLVAKLKRGRV